MTITRTPRRRRFGSMAIVIGATLMAIGLMAPPAQADPGDPVFGAGYDTYLHEPHRGVTADGFDQDDPGETCPEDALVDGMTAWHFVLPGNDHSFETLDVAFESDDDPEADVLAGLTPKSDFTGFDPTLHFIAHPTGKHAYVYTSGDAEVTLLDGAAHVSPDATLDKFVLSHTCTEGETTTDGPTDEGTTDEGTTDQVSATDSVAATDSVTDDTDTEVEGEVVLPEQLPRTGAEDRSLFILGIGFIAIGAVVLVAKRAVFIG